MGVGGGSIARYDTTSSIDLHRIPNNTGSSRASRAASGPSCLHAVANTPEQV